MKEYPAVHCRTTIQLNKKAVTSFDSDGLHSTTRCKIHVELIGTKPRIVNMEKAFHKHLFLINLKKNRAGNFLS